MTAQSPFDWPGHAVSTEWLERHLGQPGLRVLDGSWYLPTSGRNPRAEFLEAHVPGARFFDVNACSDPDSNLPHTVPSPERFSSCVEALGVTNDSWVVVYDGSGKNLSAPRVWWMFRYFGHDRVAVLDGGIGRWKAEGRPLEMGEPVMTLEAPEPFHATPRPELIRDVQGVLHATEHVVDVRSAGRFAGTAPEPRAGLRGGHIPGSSNLPYDELVDPESGLALTLDGLRERLGAAGIDPDEKVIVTCGSGTSACALAWSIARLGNEDAAIYDGSWSEWGGREDLPIATGGVDSD